jgi:hypothetical protein
MSPDQCRSEWMRPFVMAGLVPAISRVALPPLMVGTWPGHDDFAAMRPAA